MEVGCYQSLLRPLPTRSAFLSCTFNVPVFLFVGPGVQTVVVAVVGFLFPWDAVLSVVLAASAASALAASAVVSVAFPLI